jgi:hypothetical protein
MNIFIKTSNNKLINLNTVSYIEPFYLYGNGHPFLQRTITAIGLRAIQHIANADNVILCKKNIEFAQSQLNTIASSIEEYCCNHKEFNEYLTTKNVSGDVNRLINSQPQILEDIPIITAINREIKPYASNLFNLFINKLELSTKPKDKSLTILNMNEIYKEVDKLYPIALSNVIWME